MKDLEELKKYTKRWDALKTERSSWMTHWREISDYLLPRSGRFVATDRNRGDKKHNNIIDSTGTRALRVLAAGMMAGMTSPARPWFRLTTSDPDLDESSAVKAWLADVQQLMQQVFAKSNTYRALHSVYEELGAFGTAASVISSDFNSVIHHNTLTIGEYAIATDHRGFVNTLYREFQMTPAQMVGQFGKENCSRAVQNLFDKGALDEWITVCHCVEPRVDRESGRRDSKNMPYKSVYFEPESTEGKVLRESGYREFPVLAPRWATSGGDIYGNSPAMEALGDIKQLQHEQRRKAEAIDYQTRPPIIVSSMSKGSELDILPGGVSYVDSASPQGGVRSAFQVDLRMDFLLDDIQDVRTRITSSFYADLFLMLAGNDRTNMTATEVAERHEEKLLMLGPVLERLHNEFLDPLIDVTFTYLLEANLVPPAPEELQGMDLSVEYVSMLAQAQRAVNTNSVDRYVANLGQVAQLNPEVLDKFNADRWADTYADMLGIDPELITPSDQVALIRQQRAEAQAAAEEQEQANQAINQAAQLSSIPTDDGSALNSVMDQFTGYS